MKFKKGDVVVIKNQPSQGFIAIQNISINFWGQNLSAYKLYSGSWYYEHQIISRKEYEHKRDFKKLIDG